MPTTPTTTNEQEQMATGERENYVEAATFEALGELAESVEGEEWTEAFTDEELEQQDAELRSVVHAQQEAEVMSDDDVVVGW